MIYFLNCPRQWKPRRSPDCSDGSCFSSFCVFCQTISTTQFRLLNSGGEFRHKSNRQFLPPPPPALAITKLPCGTRAYAKTPPDFVGFLAHRRLNTFSQSEIIILLTALLLEIASRPNLPPQVEWQGMDMLRCHHVSGLYLHFSYFQRADQARTNRPRPGSRLLFAFRWFYAHRIARRHLHHRAFVVGSAGGVGLGKDERERKRHHRRPHTIQKPLRERLHDGRKLYLAPAARSRNRRQLRLLFWQQRIQMPCHKRLLAGSLRHVLWRIFSRSFQQPIGARPLLSDSEHDRELFRRPRDDEQPTVFHLGMASEPADFQMLRQ